MNIREAQGAQRKLTWCGVGAMRKSGVLGQGQALRRGLLITLSLLGLPPPGEGPGHPAAHSRGLSPSASSWARYPPKPRTGPGAKEMPTKRLWHEQRDEEMCHMHKGRLGRRLVFGAVSGVAEQSR